MAFAQLTSARRALEDLQVPQRLFKDGLTLGSGHPLQVPDRAVEREFELRAVLGLSFSSTSSGGCPACSVAFLSRSVVFFASVSFGTAAFALASSVTDPSVLLRS